VKQSGGRGQYGHVVLRLAPVEAGRGFSFVNAVTGGRIPAQYIPAVEKGVVKAMTSGPYAGYPVVDMEVTVLDGSYHEVDSSEFAFTEAARVCFRQLLMQSRPELLEPAMSVEVTVPEEYLGPASGSICQRRGRIESMEEQGDYKVIRGMVPLSEMFGYANVIRTLTQGRGSFTMQFEHYETVPLAIAEEIVRTRREANKIR
jgi:elongation factor G